MKRETNKEMLRSWWKSNQVEDQRPEKVEKVEKEETVDDTGIQNNDEDGANFVFVDSDSHSESSSESPSVEDQSTESNPNDHLKSISASEAEIETEEDVVSVEDYVTEDEVSENEDVISVEDYVTEEDIMDDDMVEEDIVIEEDNMVEEDAMEEIEYSMVDEISDSDSIMEEIEDDDVDYIIDDEIEIQSDISDYSDWPTDEPEAEEDLEEPEDPEEPEKRTILDCLTYEEMVAFLESVETHQNGETGPDRFIESLRRRIPYYPDQPEGRPMTSSLCSERLKEERRPNEEEEKEEKEDELDAFVRKLIHVSEHVASKVSYHSNKIRDQLLSVCFDPILELSRRVAEQIRRLSIIICQTEFSRQARRSQSNLNGSEQTDTHIIEFRDEKEKTE